VAADAAGEAGRIAGVLTLGLLALLAPQLFLFARLNRIDEAPQALDDRHVDEASTQGSCRRRSAYDSHDMSDRPEREPSRSA